jgi:hypothetical protein
VIGLYFELSGEDVMSFIPRSENYLQMSSQEKEDFNEWLSANVLPSSIVALGLLAFAIMGGGGFGGTQTAKAKPETTLARDTSLFTSSVPPAELKVPVVDRP